MNPVEQRPFPRIYTKIVSRSAKDKPDYICDGVNDDVQIQAAIDAVGAAGGGTVFLRAGTYVIGTQIDLDSTEVHLVGEGMGATVLQAKAAFSTGTAIIAADQSFISIQHLTVDGNKANQTTEAHTGIYCGFNSTAFTDIFIDNVEVKNVNLGIGIYTDIDKTIISKCISHDNEDNGIYADTSANTSKILNCISYSNASDGIFVDTSYVNVVGCTSYSNTGDGFTGGEKYVSYTNCIAYSNTAEGFDINNTNIVVSGCIAQLNGTRGISLSGSGEAQIIGSMFEDNANDQIVLSGSDDCIVSGNLVKAGATLAADDTYSGILLTSTATRNVITGNRISADFH